MEDADDQVFLGFTKQELVRWGLILVVIFAGFGSLIQGGALSGTYLVNSFMVYLPIILVMYFGILGGMYAAGLEPNKFEMVFIPTILITMLILAMSYANAIPTVDRTPSEGSPSGDTLDTSETSRPSSPDTSTSFTNGNNTGSDQIDNSPTDLEIFLKNVGTAISIIVILALLGGVLYYLINRKEFDPDIQIHKVQEYTKSAFESNNTIIEYYIDASLKIERLKGKAPDWYSPTFFADHVTESPGPPLSSYFDKLTDLYEKARFGKVRMNQEQVLEAKELYQQITRQVSQVIKEFKNMEGDQ